MNNNKFPFTTRQWQELEHQALIFKYMASGIPIPPHLLFSLRTTTYNMNPHNNSKLLFSHHHSQHAGGGGWSCFEMGMGRKIDPEPGRCRRTDGKKWRCSKEAFPDSKYCERHMHRGKNRSRKPVEVSINSHHHQPINPRPCYNETNVTMSLNFASDLRFVKEEVDEPCRRLRGFSSGSSMDDDSWRLTPLTMACSSSKQITQDHPYLQLKSSSSDGHYNSYNDKQVHDQNNNNNNTIRRDDQIQTQKTIHFFDEWPVKQKGSWLDLDDKASSVSSTQLSISMANNNTSYDFPIFSSSKTRND